MFKSTFTSKDLANSLGISSREQIYWHDKGYITADIQVEKPRIFSPTQATNAGLIRFFLDHGLVLEKAARVAQIATSIMFDTHRRLEKEKGKGRIVGHREEMVIQNSILGRIKVVGGSSESSTAEDGAIKMHFCEDAGFSLSYAFLTASKPSFEDSMYLNIGAMQRDLEVETTYYIGRIVRRIWATLNIDPANVSSAPIDTNVVIRQPQDGGEDLLVGIVGDSYLK